MGNDVAKIHGSTDGIPQLRFFRITCVGASGCGKTSLINAFVNCHFPLRPTPTEHAAVYHRRLEVVDEELAEGPKSRPYLVEIEDTPGSERAAEVDTAPRPDGKIRVGDIVKVIDDMGKVRAACMEHPVLVFRQEMATLPGRRCTVKQVFQDGSVAIQTFEGVVFDMPTKVVERSSAVESPIDEFLTMGIKPPKEMKTLQERKQHNLALLRPLSAYERDFTKPMNAHMDQTLTRNRMGYFLCFDLSDETGESVKEALALHRMLKKSIDKAIAKTVTPIIWLVGCKGDRRLESNMDVAKSFSHQCEVPFVWTSARNYHNVQETFSEMVMAIQERQQLWAINIIEGDGGDSHDNDEAGRCQQQ